MQNRVATGEYFRNAQGPDARNIFLCANCGFTAVSSGEYYFLRKLIEAEVLCSWCHTSLP